MSRNRMKNSQSLHWMGVIKWILITGLLASLGLCYIICKNQNLRLAQKTHDVQKQLEAIEARNAELAADLESMKSPKALERRLVQMHSTLVPWGDSQSSWVRLDQGTRAVLVRMGTMPKSSLNFDTTPVAASSQSPRQ
ncbi:MAG TPA: hypothetical protein VGZ93_02055 [Candidatus Methylacidiphilales bacterium]|jgi:hypothetical protein|nr:hypothetical protein [Candidatus Methylacidiphilales bacterium]